MDWLSIIATGLIAGVVLFALVVLTSGIWLRRVLRDDVTGRAPPATARQLIEAITLLQRHSQETRAQVRALSQAHQRMAGEVEALRERVGDGGAVPPTPGPSRILH